MHPLVKRLPDGRMQLTGDMAVATTRIPKHLSFDNKFLSISNGVITVKKGFTWNGCTWARDGKRDEFGIPITWIASCVHDATLPIKIKGVSQNDKNLIFYDELRNVNFRFLLLPPKPSAVLYLLGVTVFGPVAVAIKRMKGNAAQ